VRTVLAQNPALAQSFSGETPYVLTPGDEEALSFSYNDHWPFTAAGIPSVTSWGRSVVFQENRQHTQYGDYKAIDWRFSTRQTQL